MNNPRRNERASALAIMLGAGLSALLLYAHPVDAGDADADVTRNQPTTETVVAGAPNSDRLHFRPGFVLDSYAPSGQVTNIYGGPEVTQNASVATDGAGHWVAVWHSSNKLGGRSGRDYDILFSRSTDNGSTWTPPATLNTNAATDVGDDLEPVVRTDETGVWITIWDSDETSGGQYGLDRDIFFSRSTDNGETWSPPAPLNLNAAQDWGKDDEPRLATDGSSSWVAVWSSTDTLGNRIGGDPDILVAHSTDKGQTWTHPVPLNNNAATDKGFDSSPDIVTDASGRWLAAWSAGGSGLQGIGNDRDILIAHSDDDGATWSDAAPLNSNATSDTNSDWTPRLASDGRGHWVAVWSSADGLGDTIGVDRDILVSRSTDNGDTWSPARALNRNAAVDAGEDSAPTIVSDGLGDWIVAWQAWGELGYGDSSDADIAVAYSADDGVSWTDPSHINDHAAGDAVDDLLPALATDGAGHVVAAWQSFNPPDTTSKDAEWRILAAGASIASPRAGAAAAKAPVPAPAASAAEGDASGAPPARAGTAAEPATKPEQAPPGAGDKTVP